MLPRGKRLTGFLFIGFLLVQSCTCAFKKDAIKIDGSSTVYVISEAVAEEYQKQTEGHVSIGVSGTGGGFKKLCENRIDIIGASRRITDSEKELCAKNGVEYIELPVAYDGIVVVVHPQNNWIEDLTVSTLKKMFEPAAEGKLVKWNAINPQWPNREFELFTPGISSGTYDYFTKAIVGKAHSSRGDVTSSEDDNVLVHGVASTVDSLGFFGFAYYFENKDRLKLVPIIDDTKNKNAAAVKPEFKTIRDGSYSPLSRPIFIYANKVLSQKQKEFLKFYLKNSSVIAKDVGYIPLSDDAYQKAMKTLQVD